MLQSKIPKIRVLVRKRPLNKKQIAKSETDIVAIEHQQTVIVKEHKFKVDLTPYVEEYKYNFDGAYDQYTPNQHIYQTAVRPLVDCAFDGAKVSCFAYGQTGSGKTYTMLGDGNKVRGLYLLAAQDIFNCLQNRNDLDAWLSFYQIYCGKLYDLLNDKNILFARQDHKNNVNIVGLSQTKITNSNDVMEYISYGTSARVTSQNGTNVDSSRSHAILQICLKKKNKLHGKISFIDLAGSERAADHADQLQKQTRIDGAQINKSLLALKQCIRALDQNKHHTPFRGSKLTMVLKDSFTGYCKTVMIGNISPNSSSSQNTLNTLKYADRVKQLKKTKEQPFDGDKIDLLQKELMLPRNNIQLRHKVSKTKEEEERQNTKALGNRINVNPTKPKVVVHKQHTYSPKPQTSPPRPQPQSISQRRASDIQNVISSVNNATNTVAANMSNLVNNYVDKPEDIDQLSEKHDHYIELILQQQQKLIKHHEMHINETIELTKKEMQLRNQADKIGSNIEDYLNDLDTLLQQKTNSVHHLKLKIQQIKGYLRESKKIQEQYWHMQKNMYQQQEQNLLQDDQQLFA